MRAENLKQYLSEVTVQHFPKGVQVFSEGEESNGIMYFVFSGKLQVFKKSGSGEDLILRQIGPGEFFGELALVHPFPRAATIIASSEEVRLGIITRETFLGMGHESPGFLSVLLNTVIRRLTEVEEKISESKEVIHAILNQEEETTTTQNTSQPPNEGEKSSQEKTDAEFIPPEPS
ncbi:cyclic nucleotide-binding domain-containing protein [Leptospira idonii]|uniref:Cyclic nucleotide-binding domain-containing protein n=1 Tax=Leptospira idonii TaxID=1193500 RepID=A0A4R9LYX4_9LEPT|nr:cyclic nucleotide-binding domain-containing protein [Leptospira idonii]